VTVRSEEKDDNVVIVVEDTGPGIALEEQAGIWGKFIRGRSQNLSSKGTGLGLYLVKYFIELHGGTVFLTSKPGHGTKIGFSIPM
jgi:signal transduction histidine kinase